MKPALSHFGELTHSPDDLVMSGHWNGDDPVQLTNVPFIEHRLWATSPAHLALSFRASTPATSTDEGVEAQRWTVAWPESHSSRVAGLLLEASLCLPHALLLAAVFLLLH